MKKFEKPVVTGLGVSTTREEGIMPFPIHSVKCSCCPTSFGDFDSFTSPEYLNAVAKCIEHEKTCIVNGVRCLLS